MTQSDRDTTGFHDGELAVQRLAGVQDLAARLEPMVAPGELRRGTDRFLGSATFAAITARDGNGRLWTSALRGSPGFLHSATPTTLQIRTTPSAEDPLHRLPADQPVGMIVIDFVARRRLRINGQLTTAGTGGLTLEVDQAYGNCPQYIHPHRLPAVRAETSPRPPYSGTALAPEDISIVRSADTFFLGTTHPHSGNDTSHRGGETGFVDVTPAHLSWPDYPGNNMFNSFGNLSVDPTASLLFVDFPTGDTLQLSGSAVVNWTSPGVDDTGRRVDFIAQVTSSARSTT